MKSIKAEEFLQQPKEIQKVFLDWWQPEEFDIYVNKELEKHRVTQGDLEDKICNYYLRTEYIPLFTEGQLREFIEDKVESKISIIHEDNKFRIYTDSDLFGEYEKEYSEDYNILNALWNMAVETAKIVFHEKVKNK